MSSTLNYVKSLQNPDARLVPDIGQMELCIAHVEIVRNVVEERKF